ncbi:MAG: cyclic nucleotide-binding domain-containing protein [Magnetococcus sp. DMHC-6]
MYSTLDIQELIRFLATVPGFKELTDDELAHLIAPMIGIEFFDADQIIIRQGERGRTLFILFKGRVRVDVGEFHFFIDEGNMFGEMALVSSQRRGASVVAVTDCMCLTVDVETFQGLMTEYWRLTQAIASLVGQRLIATEFPKGS